MRLSLDDTTLVGLVAFFAQFRAGLLEFEFMTLDVVELLLRAQHVAEAAAQFFDDAARALHVNLAGHFDRVVVAVLAPMQWTAERVGLLLRARLAEPAAAAGTETLSHLLLHRLRQTLRALAQGVERAPLGFDGAVGVALAETALRLAHGFAGAAEVVDVALALALALLTRLALLVGAMPRFRSSSNLFNRSRNACWLCRKSPKGSPCCWPCWPCCPCWALLPLPALRSALGAAPALVLTLLEGPVAQVLLLVDHVAELVELLHHVAEVVAVHVRRRHLQVFHHLLELLQQKPRRGSDPPGHCHM